MSFEAIEKWFSGIPKAERNMPVIPYEGQTLTPLQIYDMARNGTLPADLQRKIEMRQFTTAEEIYKLGVERVKSYLESAPPNLTIYVGTKPYTLKQMLEEVEKGSAVGRAFVEAEIRKWERLYRD